MVQARIIVKNATYSQVNFFEYQFKEHNTRNFTKNYIL